MTLSLVSCQARSSRKVVGLVVTMVIARFI